jgi:hypothetical protein
LKSEDTPCSAPKRALAAFISWLSAAAPSFSSLCRARMACAVVVVVTGNVGH